MTVFGFMVAPSMYRLVRSVVVSVRSELYVDAAKVVGLSDTRIVGRHVLVGGSRARHRAERVRARHRSGDPRRRRPHRARRPLRSPRGVACFRTRSTTSTPTRRTSSGRHSLISLTILAFVLLGNALRDTLQASNRSAALKPARRKRLSSRCSGRARRRRATTSRPPQDVILSIRGLRIGYPTSADEVRRSRPRGRPRRAPR